MSIEENIAIQKQITDINVPIDEAIRLLVQKCEMTHARARERVLIARGVLIGDDRVRSARRLATPRSYCESLARELKPVAGVKMTWETVSQSISPKIRRKVESFCPTVAGYEDLALAA